MKITDFWKLRKLILLVCAGCGLTACTGLLRGKKMQEFISYDQAKVNLQSASTDSISFVYTGCSGFFIKYEDQLLIHDPFFSNEGPIGLLSFKRLASDTVAINQFFQTYFSNGRDIEGTAKLLLVSHSHYDHLLDVPYIYHQLLNQDSVLVYGNDDVVKVMEYSEEEEQLKDRQIISIEEELTTSADLPTYYSRDRRIRVLPIPTPHAPHYHSIHLYQGHIKKEPSKAGDWKEGTNFSFLIDFLGENGEIRFRIYINSAAADIPERFITPENLAKHPIDVAILCMASFSYVEDYPDYFLETLQPRHIILSHWENFFQEREKLKETPMSVPFTNMQKFLDRLNVLRQTLPSSPEWTLPNLDTEIMIYFR